jgi:hypothetical protein
MEFLAKRISVISKLKRVIAYVAEQPSTGEVFVLAANCPLLIAERFRPWYA